MKKQVKAHIKSICNYLGIYQDTLYQQTGYHFEDIQTKEELKECIRLLNNWYYIPAYLSDISFIKES